jgi:hypothetical protein
VDFRNQRRSILPQDHPLAFVGDHGSGRVIGNDRRPPHNQRHLGRLLVVESDENLTLIDGAVSLLDVVDPQGVRRGGFIQVNVESSSRASRMKKQVSIALKKPPWIADNQRCSRRDGQVVVPVHVVEFHPDDGIILHRGYSILLRSNSTHPILPANTGWSISFRQCRRCPSRFRAA